MKSTLLKMEISPLTVVDIPALERLEDETRLAFWGVDNYRRFLEDYPEYFGRKVLAWPPGLTRRLAGFLLARSLFENLEILKVGVYPEFHRRGVGTLLMDAAYAEGLRRGCRRCFLEVRKSNEGAIDFYHRHGFKVAGSRLNYYTNPVEDAWIMERAL
jgi:ribosomal-protein-alanine N-acetyltransferase